MKMRESEAGLDSRIVKIMCSLEGDHWKGWGAQVTLKGGLSKEC